MFNSAKKLILFVFIVLAATVSPMLQGAYAQGPAAFSDPGARQVSGGSGGFVAVEQDVDGGVVPIGATAQVVVRFRNEGSQSIQTGLIRLYPSSTVSATISLDQCKDENGGGLAPGAECAIALSIKGLQAGAWRVEMLMSHSGRSRLVNATVSGTVEASAEGADRLTSDIEAIPNKIDFETLDASQTLVKSIVLRNVTSIPVSIEELYIDSDDRSGFSMKSECEKLEPGQACIATVKWAPKVRGPVSGVFVVKHDGPAALTSVTLKGAYEPENVDEAELFPEAIPGKGLLVSSLTEVDFGDQIETSSTITMSLVNSGDSDLTIETVDIAGADNGLSFKGDGCEPGDILAPAEACPLTIEWAPTRVGLLLDDVMVTHDGARGVLVLPVRGTSTAAVSKDQGAIVLSTPGPLLALPPRPIDDTDLDDDLPSDPDESGNVQPSVSYREPRPAARPEAVSFAPTIANPASVLDGLKITSFSPTRAIIAGPGGSRIVFDDEETVLGGIPWMANMQRNGIEFSYQGQHVLLLFDRSLSSVNRVDPESAETSSSSSSGDSDESN